MKVTRSSEDMLHIRPVREAMLLILPGLFLGLFCFTMFFFVGQTGQLSCERVELGHVQCELRRTLLGIPWGTHSIPDLQGARVQTHESTTGDTYEVMLVTGAGEDSLTGHSSSGYEEKQRIAQQINGFLDDPGQPSLMVRQSGLSGAIVSALLTITGLLVFTGGLRTYNTTWTFDRRRGVFTHRQGRLLGAKVVRYPLHEIAEVGLGVFSDMEGSRIYRIVLRTTSGDELPMTSQYYFWHRHLKETVVTMREFLSQ